MRVLISTLAALAAFALPAAAQTVPQREMGGALQVENVPETPADVSDRLRQYVNTRAAGFADWLPGGGVLIVTCFGDTAQLHRVDQPMGAHATDLLRRARDGRERAAG